MNDKDKEAFKKWIDFIEVAWGIDGKKVYVFDRGDMGEAWQAACEYKQKEIDGILDKEDMLRDYINNIRNGELETLQAELLEYKEVARSEAQLVNELQAENAALRANINGTRMKQMNEEIERLKAENARLRECVEFYANQDNWQKNFGSPLESNARKIKNDDLWMDESQTPTGGKRARQCLKELEEK